MAASIADLTPRQIVAELDKYIVGQGKAKRAVGEGVEAACPGAGRLHGWLSGLGGS